MDDQTLTLLRNADWVDLSLRLRRFIVHTWGKMLPAGYTPDDVVAEVIEKTFREERPWDPTKRSLATHLRWCIKSTLSKKGLYGLKENNVMTFTNDDAQLEPEPDVTAETVSDLDKQQAWEALEKEIAGNKDLVDFRDGIISGMTNKEIGQLLDKSPQQAAELRRRFDRYVVKAAQRFNNGVGGDK